MRVDISLYPQVSLEEDINVILIRMGRSPTSCCRDVLLLKLILRFCCSLISVD